MLNNLLKNIDKKSFGLCLVVLGVYLGNFIRVISGINIVNLLMILAILLLVDYKNIFKLKFPSLSPMLFFLLVSQIIIVIYNVYSDYKMEYVMLFYSIAIIGGLASINKKVQMDKFIFYLFYLSCICVAIAFYSFTGGSGVVDVYQAASDIVKNTEQDGKSMAFVYPNTALINAFSSLCMLKEKIKYRKFIPILILFDLFFILACGKRTPLITLIFCIIYYYWETNQLKFEYRSIIKLFANLLLMLILFVFANNIELIHSFVESSIEKINAGVSILMNMDSGIYDESAETRIQIRQQMKSIFDNFSWYNYILGYGIFSYGDQPLLQSLLDMGLVGVFVYVYCILLFPLRYIFKKEKKRGLLFFTFMSIGNILTCMSAGMPYGYLLYYPIAGLIFFSFRKTEPNKKNKIYERV